MDNSPFQLICAARTRLRNASREAEFEAVVDAQRLVLTAIGYNTALCSTAVAIVVDVYGTLLQMVLVVLTNDKRSTFDQLNDQAISSLTHLLEFVDGRPFTPSATAAVDHTKPTLEID